jgi:Tol biopolymer transport system component
MRDGNEEIHVMNADGSDARTLTHLPASDTDPPWSPDGLQVAFSSNRDSNYEIYVMDADGSNPRRFTNSPTVDASRSGHPMRPRLLLPLAVTGIRISTL